MSPVMDLDIIILNRLVVAKTGVGVRHGLGIWD